MIRVLDVPSLIVDESLSMLAIAALVLLLAILLVCYVVLTQLMKMWFYRRFGD